MCIFVHNRELAVYLTKRNKRKKIIKTGIYWKLLLAMDDRTFQQHMRVTRRQCNFIQCAIERQLQEQTGPAGRWGGRPQISVTCKTLLLLWYLANDNSYREMCDKFGMSKSSAHRVINSMLDEILKLGPQFIKWWTDVEKECSANNFKSVSGYSDVIGAIDGCHIRINRPPTHGDDYINRKGYFSVLLQGVCDEDGLFRSIFTGPPGRVHDARMCRLSPVFAQRHERFGDRWKLFGDTAYISADFHGFIITPKRDTGCLSVIEKAANSAVSRSRVVIENAFGRLKCRFRRLRHVDNVNLPAIIKVIVACCILHNIAAGMDTDCPEHPDGCPRYNDTNNDLAG